MRRIGLQNWIALVLIVMADCAPDNIRVRIIDAMGQKHKYAWRDVTLTTLHDVKKVSGDVAQIYGDSLIAITLDWEKAERGGLRERWIKHAYEVQASWVYDKDVIVADDFDSLLMFTLYAHLESIYHKLDSVYASQASYPVPVYYAPEFSNADDYELPEEDNAFYVTEIDAFLLLPPRRLQDIPLAANKGVIAHEFSHRIWYFEFWDAKLFATLNKFGEEPGALQSWNRIQATNEGVADFVGAVLTGNPAFLAASLPESMAADRDLQVVRVMQRNWLDGVEPMYDEIYNPYLAGSVVASALWHIGQLPSLDLDLVLAGVLQAERDLSPLIQNSFTYFFGMLEAYVITSLAEESRSAACESIFEHYLEVWYDTPLADLCENYFTK